MYLHANEKTAKEKKNHDKVLRNRTVFAINFFFALLTCQICDHLFESE